MHVSPCSMGLFAVADVCSSDVCSLVEMWATGIEAENADVSPAKSREVEYEFKFDNCLAGMMSWLAQLGGLGRAWSRCDRRGMPLQSRCQESLSRGC